jgi:hypothetical protein
MSSEELGAAAWRKQALGIRLICGKSLAEIREIDKEQH